MRTNQIPRQIPEQSFFTKPIPGIVMGGILPFGCIFIQLFFILNSIWYDENYVLTHTLCSKDDVYSVIHCCLSLCLGLTRCTTCLGFCSWFSSFCSSPALRPQFCSATSTCVLRYLNIQITYHQLSVCTETLRLVSACLITSSFVMRVQDYHWWWRSFLTSGFTAVYLFIYAVHYFFSKLQIIGAASTFLYFGYTMIMVLIFFLLTGEA